MNWADFKSIASFIGIPGAMMAVVVWCFIKGHFITGREHKATVADRDARLVEVSTDRDWWKEKALKLWNSAQELAGTAERAVSHATEVSTDNNKKKRE